ncbi:non-ribosomal peptide synthetase [Cribrihabitans neustonicus]|uniref:non-ribosomal peptide synthetase n=1 Tax=Cribrihabitans neustonicus TaxID=1429085 RepID=UPI003B5A7168
MFEHVFADHGDAIAFETFDEKISYARLDRESRELAERLLETAPAPGSIVAIELDRGPGLGLAVVATLRAGLGCLVLDPRLPVDRAVDQIAQVRAGRTIRRGIDSNITIDIRGSHKTNLIDQAGIAGQVTAHPGFPAYVVFTSGSTGRPKGVEVSRGALAAHLHSAAEAFGYGPTDRALHFAPQSFDVFYEQLLLPLSVGATVFWREGTVWGNVELSAAVVDHNLTVVNLPTSFFRQWIGGFSRPAPKLRVVIAGAEEMTRSDVKVWREHPLAAHAALINAYGPTESVVTASCHLVDPTNLYEIGVPIGAGMPGRSLVVAGLEEPPVGELGEVAIRGILASHYVGNPRLTAALFRPLNDGAREYRTGDICTTTDCEFVFGRRVDSQMKVRGHRIEAQEVATAVRELLLVSDVQVLTHDGLSLTAFYVAPDGEIAFQEMVTKVASRLPAYMIPSNWIRCERFPTSLNGKVDVKALAAQLAADPISTDFRPEPKSAAAGSLEEQISALVRTVLGVDSVTAATSFFDIGAHSLQLLELLDHVDQEFGVQIGIVSFFEEPTINGLVASVNAQQAVDAELVR